MIEYSKIYANYWFENHKGYWTKEHMNSLNSYGLINWFHRVSYKPIKQHFEKKNIIRRGICKKSWTKRKFLYVKKFIN